jgi:preprotein translocase subunit SecF
MKDFAFALLIGMTSGVYSTIFIASAFVHYWERGEKKRALKKTLAASSAVPKKA